MREERLQPNGLDLFLDAVREWNVRCKEKNIARAASKLELAKQAMIEGRREDGRQLTEESWELYDRASTLNPDTVSRIKESIIAQHELSGVPLPSVELFFQVYHAEKERNYRETSGTQASSMTATKDEKRRVMREQVVFPNGEEIYLGSLQARALRLWLQADEWVITSSVIAPQLYPDEDREIAQNRTLALLFSLRRNIATRSNWQTDIRTGVHLGRKGIPEKLNVLIPPPSTVEEDRREKQEAFYLQPIYDTSEMTVEILDRTIRFNSKEEMKTLQFLTSHPGEWIRAYEIAEEIMHDKTRGREVRRIILNLRKKLGDAAKAPCFIESDVINGESRYRWICTEERNNG